MYIVMIDNRCERLDDVVDETTALFCFGGWNKIYSSTSARDHSSRLLFHLQCFLDSSREYWTTVTVTITAMTTTMTGDDGDGDGDGDDDDTYLMHSQVGCRAANCKIARQAFYEWTRAAAATSTTTTTLL